MRVTNELEARVEAIIGRLPEDLPLEWLTELGELGLWIEKSEDERVREERQLVTDFWGAIRTALCDLLMRRQEAGSVRGEKALNTRCRGRPGVMGAAPKE
jgi:hypothetical protein